MIISTRTDDSSQNYFPERRMIDIGFAKKHNISHVTDIRFAKKHNIYHVTTFEWAQNQTSKVLVCKQPIRLSDEV